MAMDGTYSVWVLDDGEKVCAAIRKTLQRSGYSVTAFQDSTACLSSLAQGRCGLLICDLRMPGTDGMEVLRQARKTRPTLPVMLISAFADVEKAVAAMKLGAVDFLEKPLDQTVLVARVRQILNPQNCSPAGGAPLTRMLHESWLV